MKMYTYSIRMMLLLKIILDEKTSVWTLRPVTKGLPHNESQTVPLLLTICSEDKNTADLYLVKSGPKVIGRLTLSAKVSEVRVYLSGAG